MDARLRDCQPSRGFDGLRGRADNWWRLGWWREDTILCVRQDTISCVWQGAMRWCLGRHWSCEAERDGVTARPVRWWAKWWKNDMINPNALRKIVG
jgi:hypothetical protein